MNNLGRSRFAGVILLLLVQTALAAFLAFLSTKHWEESNRFHRKLSLEFTPIKEATQRYQLENVAALTDAATAAFATVLLLGSTLASNNHSAFRKAHQIAGWLFLICAAGLFYIGFIVPRVGSPDDDMLPNIGFFASSVVALVMCGCSFVIAGLVKASSNEPPVSGHTAS